MLQATAYRTAKERTLFIIALVFSSLVWIGIVASLVGLLYAPFVALGVVVAHAFLLARLTGNAVRLGSRQLPDLYKRVEHAASRLGMERLPEVYVVSGGGILNAFATKLFSRHFVILNAEIIDACETLDDGKETSAVDFIIGHELGHLALGHLSWNWLLWPAKLVPILGPAYSRACEYSADACGLAAVDDVEAASRALAVLAAGGRQARKVNLDALIEQRHDAGGFIMGLVELNSTHPYLSKRVAALHRTPEIGRNPFSYVLAPFFSMAAGGVASYAMAYVAIVGVLAAVAIPNFMKFQERAKAASLIGAEPQPSFDEMLAKAQAEQQQQALPPPVVEVPPVQPVVAGDDLGAPPPPPPRFEARAWLKTQTKAKNKEAIASLSTAKAVTLVDKLYKSGAKTVWVSDVQDDDHGSFANDIVAEMPEKAKLRKALIAVCTSEYKKLGYDEPCEDEGADVTTELYFNWQ